MRMSEQLAAGSGMGYSNPAQDFVVVETGTNAEHNLEQMDCLSPIQDSSTNSSVPVRGEQHLQPTTSSSKIYQVRQPPSAGPQYSDSKVPVCNYDSSWVGKGTQDGGVEKQFGWSYGEATSMEGLQPASAQLPIPARTNSIATSASGQIDTNSAAQIASPDHLLSMGASGRGRWSRSMRRGPVEGEDNTVSAE